MELNTLEIIGWIGNLGFLLGAIYLGKVKRIGWLWQMMGCWLYVLIGLEKHIYSMVILDAILFFINFGYWLKWRKNNV